MFKSNNQEVGTVYVYVLLADTVIYTHLDTLLAQVADRQCCLKNSDALFLTLLVIQWSRTDHLSSDNFGHAMFLNILILSYIILYVYLNSN
jgi:hypothetical protein